MSEYSVRFVAESDHELFDAWYEAHGAVKPARAILPACGIIAMCDGEPMCVTWIYQDNSCGVCFPQWYLSNPSAPPRVIAKSFDVLIGGVESAMEGQGRVCIFSFTAVRGIGKILKRKGYKEGHSATEYWRII